jgi:hypothetical protein
MLSLAVAHANDGFFPSNRPIHAYRNQSISQSSINQSTINININISEGKERRYITNQFVNDWIGEFDFK